MFRVVLLVGLVATGCSNSGHSCKLGATCEDVTATGSAAAGAQHDCEAVKGTWSSGTCPSADRIGTCAITGANTVIYYGDGPDAFTVPTATANCEHERHGTWTPTK
jgi:hypothetical protein